LPRTPRTKTYLAINELQVTKALRITVPSPVFRTSLVVRKPSRSTILIHRYKVQRTIKAARKVRNIDVKRELVVQEVELSVRCVGAHEIETRADVLGICAHGDEGELEGVARSCRAVGFGVVGALESTIGGTGNVTWAERGVPGVSLWLLDG